MVCCCKNLDLRQIRYVHFEVFLTENYFFKTWFNYIFSTLKLTEAWKASTFNANLTDPLMNQIQQIGFNVLIVRPLLSHQLFEMKIGRTRFLNISQFIPYCLSLKKIVSVFMLIIQIIVFICDVLLTIEIS